VRENPRLHIYLLVWDFNMVYAAEREMFQAWRLRGHSRLHVGMDANHPAGASQHQKLVVIDDAFAFCGGIDLSRWRWDTPEHLAGDPRRIDPDGKPYPPFHDMMVALDGAAAEALGKLARQRWGDSGDRIEPLPAHPRSETVWPASLKPCFRDQQVGIARTFPAHAGREAVREVEALYLESVAAARHSIYIENQYFTARRLARALAQRLAEDDGPEVVLVLPHHTGGWLEQATMDVLRTGLLAELEAADRDGRLRVYYPYQQGLGEDCISVHAKLMIVDDRLLRIGSANTSNRSMGLDSECDLAIEADNDETRQTIRGLRERLLAEHLGVPEQSLTRTLEAATGLVAGIDALRTEGRSLRPLEIKPEDARNSLLDDGQLVDPDEPISPDYFVARYVPRRHRPGGRRRLLLFLGLIAMLLAAAAAWRWTPLAQWLDAERVAAALRWFDNPLLRALAVIVGISVASLLMVPLTVLVIAAALLLGPWEGFGLALAGALISAMLGFMLGQVLSSDHLMQLTGSRVERLSKRIAKSGVMAVAILRLVPVAPFTVVNLIAGASHVSAAQFLIGSALGLAPGIFAITLFSGSLYEAVTDPGPLSIGVLALVLIVLIGATLGLRRLLRSSG
jgi:phospholipase D1/2